MVNKIVLNNIYQDILELSNKELQISYWITGDQGKISSYVELMCSLFDDNSFDTFISTEAKNIGMSTISISELEKLKEKLEAYNGENKTQEEIINDPQWEEIRKQAKIVLDYWNKEKLT